jgi:hypothetical protein
MSTLTPVQPAGEPAAEAVPLAQQMHAALAEAVSSYRQALKCSPGQALSRLAGPLTPERREQSLLQPPCATEWLELEALAEADPEAATRRWEEIRQAARDELACGRRAVHVVGGRPWEQAQFLAVRDSLAEQWQPRGGLEWRLIDTLAQAYAQWECWLRAVVAWDALGAEEAGRASKDGLGRAPPRLTMAEALERAAAMADRFNRIFLRTLRALRDLRRYSPTIVVPSGGQVNVGGQQLNVAGQPAAVRSTGLPGGV